MARTFPLGIMRAALARAGLVEGLDACGAAFVECFICEHTVERTAADYDEQFDLWECHACRKQWS